MEAVKLSEDREDELVARLYEAWGREASTMIGPGFDLKRAYEANLIEEKRGDRNQRKQLLLELFPFEIKTIVLRF